MPTLNLANLRIINRTGLLTMLEQHISLLLDEQDRRPPSQMQLQGCRGFSILSFHLYPHVSLMFGETMNIVKQRQRHNSQCRSTLTSLVLGVLSRYLVELCSIADFRKRLLLPRVLFTLTAN